MAKKGNQSNTGEASGFLQRLQELNGSSVGLQLEMLDATLLWLATVAVAENSASLTIGVTQSGDSWSVQIWDGREPYKTYYRDTEALNTYLARVTRAYKGRAVSPEVEQILQGYGT